MTLFRAIFFNKLIGIGLFFTLFFGQIVVTSTYVPVAWEFVMEGAISDEVPEDTESSEQEEKLCVSFTPPDYVSIFLHIDSNCRIAFSSTLVSCFYLLTPFNPPERS